MRAPDTVLQNRYIIVRTIGQGGMGAVYLAKDQRLGHQVALKETFFTDDLMRRAFEREAQMLAGLRHASLPKVTDHFIEGGGQFLVMEFIPGDDLAKMLALQKGPFPVDRVAQWADHLLDALDYLHTQESPIIHRDIKPHNLKITPRGEIILLDFGLAKRRPQLTVPTGASDSVYGYTPHYAPLEQIQGTGTEPRSDIYALGATLYHLLTGVQPVDAMTRALSAVNSQPDPLRPAHELNPKIPRALSYLLSAALAQQINARPRSAAEMREAMRDAVKATVTDVVAPSVVKSVAMPAEPWASRYELLDLLGRGAQGETYRARDRKSGETVCLKRLHASVDEQALMQECRALTRLRHPNIVRLLDFDIRPPAPYLVLEYVHGPRLSDYMRAHGKIAEPVALAIGQHLLDALLYAHDQGIIHCDLEPGNILLQFTGTEIVPKILDFGTAQVDRSGDSGSASVPVSFQYLAPEQIEGRPITDTTDTYALAQIIWEMIAGRPAFTGTPLEIYKAKRALVEGLDLRDASANASEPLRLMIRQCTHADPARRPSSPELSLASKVILDLPPQVVAGPANMGFDLREGQGAPPGWFNSVGFVEGVSENYRFAVIPRTSAPGLCLRMWSGRASDKEFGSLMQRVPAWHLAGRRVRFEGDLTTGPVDGWAGLWLRADGSSRMLFFDNMYDRAVRGTTGWTRYRIEARLPAGTRWLNYGVLLAGRGQLRADNFRLLAEDDEGQWPAWTLWDDAGYKMPGDSLAPR